jgi:hypothetical protein
LEFVEDNEILFGGVGPMPPRMIKSRKSEGQDWFAGLEKEYNKLSSTEEGKKLYGDPEKGMTIEQIWHTYGLIGKWPVCLLALGKHSVKTNNIERVVKMNSQQLVKVLADILGLSNRATTQILYYDGRTGHSHCSIQI